MHSTVSRQSIDGLIMGSYRHGMCIKVSDSHKHDVPLQVTYIHELIYSSSTVGQWKCGGGREGRGHDSDSTIA